VGVVTAARAQPRVESSATRGLKFNQIFQKSLVRPMDAKIDLVSSGV
jgi:hypothetical protein